MPRIISFKRINKIALTNPIHIPFAMGREPGMKIVRHNFTIDHNTVQRQHTIQRLQHAISTHFMRKIKMNNLPQRMNS